MSDKAQNSEAGYQELLRVLEEAVQAGVSSIGLEYKDRELMVFHQVGPMGFGVRRIPKDLEQAFIDELCKRAGLQRKPKGRMTVKLQGKDYEVAVREYDSFGESAYELKLKEKKPARG